jgi:hypothetical protein
MKPGEHKTVQSRILKYAQEIGWTFVPREVAESRRGFDPEVPPKDRAKGASLFYDDLLDAKIRQFNPRYSDAEGAILGKFRHPHTKFSVPRDHYVPAGAVDLSPKLTTFRSNRIIFRQN